ncbi:MAG TPA: B12-binding domain-containing radical SAM protein [Longimicrobiales bacterium]
MGRIAPDPRRLLLAHSYYLRYDAKQLRKMRPYPPLATLIVAALARERGFDVHLFDAMLSSGVDAFEAMLGEVRPAVVGIVEDNFNFLTKMCTLRMRRAALDMIRAAKAHGCRVAVNGADATDHPELFLEAGADAVIVGEVEPTFLELAEAWRTDPGAALDGIAGLILPERASAPAGVGARNGGAGPSNSVRPALPLVPVAAANGSAAAHAAGNGHPSSAAGVRRTAPRAPLQALDALPFPAWDLVDVERYRSAWTDAHGRFSWNMVTSRGCPYKCNWCAKPLFGRRYVQRTPASVAEEMRRLRDQVAPDHIWFADDIFGLTPAWIEAFADEVERRGARTPFMIQSRVNLMKPRTVAALRRAGAEEVWLGVESGSQKILDAMDKGTRIEQILTATRALRAEGVRSAWFIQLGYLGETWEDLLLTRDLIREARPDEIGVSVSYPLPGTKFYDMVRAQLGAKRNWEHTDDLDMMFHGTYTTEFYRRIRGLLHEEVDALAAGAASGDFDRQWAELEAVEAEFRNR